MFSRKPQKVTVKKWNMETLSGEEEEFTEQDITMDGSEGELKEAEGEFGVSIGSGMGKWNCEVRVYCFRSKN